MEKRDVPIRADNDNDEQRGASRTVLDADPKAEDGIILERMAHATVIPVSRKRETLLLVLDVMIILENFTIKKKY